MQILPSSVKIVEACKIKTSKKFTVQSEIQHIKIKHRYFSAEVIDWRKCWKVSRRCMLIWGCYGGIQKLLISSFDDILLAFNLVLLMVKSFNGDPEKFYPQFCKAFSSTKLWCITIDVLAHLTGQVIQEILLTFNGKTEKFLEKDLLLKKFTLLALFLGYFTEESVVPQKILACIANNVCHFWRRENVLVRILPFQNIRMLILWIEEDYRKLMKMLYLY